MIQKFIKEICDILDIKVPEVSYDTSNFPTDTMLAQVNPAGDVIYLKCRDEITPDALFAIAHELRHVWQIKNNIKLYFSEYRPIDIIGNVEEYNLQIAELDANAFAGIVMIDLFRLKPLFEGVPESVKKKIYERMEQMKITEFSQ